MNEPTIVMRYEVRASDAPSVRRMVVETDYFSAAETEIAVELVDERLSKGAASGYEFVLAESDGQVIGYACYGEIPCTVGSYDLYWVVVDKTHQRTGIGRRLVDEVEMRVRTRGGRGIYIDTSGSERYASTQRFYERCGYHVAANLPDFYSVGDPKLVYFRRIAGPSEGI